MIMNGMDFFSISPRQFEPGIFSLSF